MSDPRQRRSRVCLLQQQKGQPVDVGLRVREQGRRRRDGQPLRGRFGLQRLFRDQLHELRPLMKTEIVIGTRGSNLALWQANWVKSAMSALHPTLDVRLSVIKTKGDKILDVPLAKVGGKGLFVKEIEEALLDGRVDLAVHSMKDMPADMPPGLRMGPVPAREDPRDVLVCARGETLDRLRPGACIGTSSLRRAAQIRHVRPDVRIVSLRGNLDTRLNKLATEDLDAIVLAAAGVRRLGFEDRVSEYLDPSVMLPAVAQGALCIQLRADDAGVLQTVEGLDHPDSRRAVAGERAFLKRLGGSCQVPIAAHGQVMTGGRYRLTGLVADLSGQTVIRETVSGPVDQNVNLGTELAQRLLDRGAGRVLAEIVGAEQP